MKEDKEFTRYVDIIDTVLWESARPGGFALMFCFKPPKAAVVESLQLQSDVAIDLFNFLNSANGMVEVQPNWEPLAAYDHVFLIKNTKSLVDNWSSYLIDTGHDPSTDSWQQHMVNTIIHIARSCVHLWGGKTVLTKIGYFNKYDDKTYYQEVIAPSHELSSMTRTEIIQELIDRFEYKNYLEIGLGDGKNFKSIECDRKTVIEPSLVLDSNAFVLYENETMLCQTSDEFFEAKSQKNPQYTFDIIFIDGLHTYQQVKKDIDNSLNILSDGGTIVVHDLNPKNWFSQAFPPESNGDCWKAFAALRSTRADLNMVCINTDQGCGIIRKGKQAIYSPKELEFELSYEYYDTRRKEIMNMISPEQLSSWINNQNKGD